MRPRILHVIPFLWSGAGRVVSQLCLAQTFRRDVAIVTSGVSKGQADWPAYRSRLAAGGVMHHCIDFFDRDSAAFWTGVEALDALISTWRPDVVHTHAGVPACAAAAVRDRSGRGFRHINHVYSWGAGRPAWMSTMDLAGIRRADAVVASAAAYRDLLLDSGVPAGRVAYVPWGLDLTAIRSAVAPAPQRPGRTPRIGFVGRIEPRKGQLELVQGFARYHRGVPSATLELVGPVADPDYAARVERAVRDLHLRDAVRMRGQVRNPYRSLAGWDLFVSLSADEGQGLAILEAMALGVPVLARAVAGVEDYLRDGVTGWACSSATPRVVAESINRVLADRRRASIATRARKMVDECYTWDRTVQAIERLYGGGAAVQGDLSMSMAASPA